MRKRKDFRGIGVMLAGLTVYLASSGTAAAGAECASVDPASTQEARSAPEATADSPDFVSGGIGGQEARAFRDVKASWPLAITMVERKDGRDRFTSRVYVEVHDADERRVFCVDAAGPYLFISLPPGDYRISARSMDDVTREQAVSLKAGAHRPLTLVWE